jgi:hypothetical protein
MHSYMMRPRIPELPEDEPPLNWIEEPLEWIEPQPSIEEASGIPEGPREMTASQRRRLHRRAKAAAARERESNPHDAGGQTQDEGGKAVAMKWPVYENLPARGRRKGLADEGQYGIEDLAFGKIIAAKRKTKEAPPSRGRGDKMVRLLGTSQWIRNCFVSEVW